jgi:hypothetical protein
MIAMIPLAWTDGVIVALGVVAILIFRGTPHKNRLGYISMGTVVVLLFAIAFRGYRGGDVNGFWMFCILGVALAVAARPLADRFMSLNKPR